MVYFYVTLYENRNNLKSEELKQFPKVSIVVPAYNEQDTIAKTLDSLLELDYPKDKVEIVVLDDGSTDDTYKIAKEYKKKGVIVFTKENGGKGLALNFALTKVTGEFFGALDADSYVDSQALKRIMPFFKDPNVMGVTPSLKIWKPQSFLQHIQRVEFLVGIFLRKVFGFLRCIHVAPGPFTIYRKEFFDKYGNYDHTTITEDIEIALRTQSLHYNIENSVDAYVYTKGPNKFFPLFRQRIRWYRGFLDNLLRYKQLFSSKYGELGLFILPASVISVFFVIITLFYTAYKLSDDLINRYLLYSSIGFDWSHIFDWNFDWFLVNLGPIAFLSIISLIGAVSMIAIAKKISEEKPNVKFSYLMYFFFYWILFGSWWFVAIYYKVTGKKIRWAGRLM
ncbi:glycosyltransferase family 2 protein [Candidatus Woesearchaeota archaeon]|nr:glycosyltransferase family 2 protein [Candidatus Woesearchaeota archaeon]